MIRKLLLFLAIAIVVVLLAGAGLWFFIPDSYLRDQLQRTVRHATGRTVSIEGDFSLQRWPPALHAEKIRLANPDWVGEPDMLSVAALDFAIDPWPLLRGQLVISRFEIRRPDVLLVRKGSRANWQFGEPGEGGRETAREAPAGGAPEEAKRLLLARLVVREGRLRFRDLEAGSERVLDAVDIEATQDPISRAFELKAQMRMQGEPVRISAELPGPLALAQESRPFMLDIELPGGGIRANGEAGGTPPRMRGQLDIAFDDLRRTLEILGVRTALPEEVARTFVLKAKLEGEPGQMRASDLALRLDAMKAEGALTVAMPRGRPRIEADLTFDRLVLDPYLPEQEGTPGEPAAQQAEGAAAPEAEGWSEEPITLPLPLPFDAEANLAFAGLRARGIELGAGRLQLRVDGPRARADILELAAYDGTVKGSLQLEAGTPHFLTLEGEMEKVQLRPLLRTFGFDRLEGRGNASFELSTRGRSQRAFVEALNGKGRLLFRDGAILGINIGAMVRRVMTLGRASGEEPRKTDFAELGGSFRIEKGIVHNDDLSLKAPLLRVKGSGTVDLPARRLAYRLEPAIATTLEGQGASGEPSFQAGVPIVLEGPWSAVEWRFDIGGKLTEAIRDPAELGQLVGKLRENPEFVSKLGDRLGTLSKPGELGQNLLKDVLGNGATGEKAGTGGPRAPEQPAAEPGDKARKLLQGILGR